MEILAKLFGSAARVKILRLFLFNERHVFDLGSIAKRTKVSRAAARGEVGMMEQVGLIRRRALPRGRAPSRRGRLNGKGWMLDERFPYLEALRHFLVHAAPFSEENLLRRIRGTGKLKLVIIAGVFIQDPDSRVDLLVVGDEIRRKRLETAIKDIEAELGRELRCAAFSTADFTYRLGMYDKLIRDILDYPHKTLVDKLGLP